MLEHDLALRQPLPAPRQHFSAREDSALSAAVRAIGARMRMAEELLPDDADAAALLLDDVLAAIAALRPAYSEWQASTLYSVPSVECGASYFNLRLRPGLRAPNVDARLAHCRDLLRLIAEDEGDEHHVG